MARIIRHPRSGAGASVRLQELRQSLEADRERAIRSLGVAVAKLEALRALCELPTLSALIGEYSAFIDALGRVDAANVDDGLAEQLQFIRSRLLSDLETLKRLTTTEGAPHGQ